MVATFNQGIIWQSGAFEVMKYKLNLIVRIWHAWKADGKKGWFIPGSVNKVDLNQKEFISRILGGLQDH